MRILGIAGSLRQGSVNRRLLHAAAATDEHVHLEILEGLGALPHFNEDAESEPPPPGVAALREAIATADAVLIATPEYNASVPGVLKNALDWASRPRGAAPLTGKPLAVVGASPGRFGAARAQADLRRVATSIGARVLDRELAVAHAFDAISDEGHLASPDQQATLEALVDELRAMADAETSAAGSAA